MIPSVFKTLVFYRCVLMPPKPCNLRSETHFFVKKDNFTGKRDTCRKRRVSFWCRFTQAFWRYVRWFLSFCCFYKKKTQILTLFTVIPLFWQISVFRRCLQNRVNYDQKFNISLILLILQQAWNADLVAIYCHPALVTDLNVAVVKYTSSFLVS